VAGPAWVRTTEVEGEAGTPVTPVSPPGRRAGLEGVEKSLTAHGFEFQATSSVRETIRVIA
jgi:hypothetical protein